MAESGFLTARIQVLIMVSITWAKLALSVGTLQNRWLVTLGLCFLLLLSGRAIEVP